MKQWNFLFLLLLITAGQDAFSQIEISEETQKKEERVIPTVPTIGTEVFAIFNWSSTNRLLEENPAKNGLFADSLGTRADEFKLGTWSYGIGFRSQTHDHFMWQGGISLLRNGESYEFTDTDTSFSYQTRYTYVSMPFKAFYTYGNQFKVYVGGGLIPQMFVGYRQDQQWETSTNAKGDETIKTRSGYASFVLSAVANIGIQVRTGAKTTLIVEPEYRYQLTNSYEKTDSYRHLGRAFGINFGLTYKL